MTDIPSRPPLWQVMVDAYDTSPPAPADADNDWTDRHGYAAEIRAVANRIDSGEVEIQRPPSTASLYALLQWARCDERRRIRDELLLEADRAERGEL